LQPADCVLKFLYQEMISKAPPDRIDDAAEVPDLALGARIEGFPYGVGVLCRLEVRKQSQKIVEHVCGFDEDSLLRHAFDVADLFLLANIPGVDLVESPPFVLGDLEYE
jgi:hypothetical protein